MITSAQWPPREGVGNFVSNLSRSLAKRGHEVTVLVRSLRAPRQAEESEGSYRVIGAAFIPFPPFHVDSHKLFLRHAIMSRTPKPDIIHYHSPLVPSAMPNIPSIVTMHSPMLSGVERMEHSDLGYVASKALLHLVSLRTEKRLLRDSCMVVPVSSRVGDELNRVPYEVPVKKISVLMNGVDHNLYTPGTDCSDANVIFWAGRLASGKGIDDLIECMKLVKESCSSARLRIAGQGPMGEYLRKSIEKSGLRDSAELLGWLPRQKMLEEYRKAGVFLLTSHYEGMPTVLLEAMSCSKICVTTNVGGATDIIEDGVNGFVVPVGDVQPMADRLVDVMKRPDQYRDVGTRAREFVVSNISWEMIAAGYERLYSAILERRGVHEDTGT
jgi:glycosyltransferase involved in cell wall biosynthesis